MYHEMIINVIYHRLIIVCQKNVVGPHVAMDDASDTAFFVQVAEATSRAHRHFPSRRPSESRPLSVYNYTIYHIVCQNFMDKKPIICVLHSPCVT